MRRKLRSGAVLALISHFFFFSLNVSIASPSSENALAISPDGSRLYVGRLTVQSHRPMIDVSVIDTAALRMIADLRPKGSLSLCSLAVSSDNSRLYVGEIDAVTILDTVTFSPVATIKAGPLPVFMAPSLDGRRLYVANADLNWPDPYHPLHPDGGLTVIDTTTNTAITTLDVGRQNRFTAVSPDGHRVYVITNEGPLQGSGVFPASSLKAIDADTLRVTTSLSSGRYFDQGVLSSDGQRIYITAASLTGEDSFIEVYDTATNQRVEELKIAAGNSAAAIQPVVSPDGKRVYLTMAGSIDAIRVLDAKTLQFNGSVKLPDGSELLTISPDGSRLYSLSGRGADMMVTVVDTATLQPAATMKLGPPPT